MLLTRLPLNLVCLTLSVRFFEYLVMLGTILSEDPRPAVWRLCESAGINDLVNHFSAP